MSPAGLDMQGQQTSSQAANRCAAYPQQQMPPAGLDMQGQQMPMGYDGGSHQAGPPDAGDAVAGGQRGNPGGGQAYPGAGSGALAGGGSTRAPEAEIKAGWLFKKAESSWGWRKRWFVLYPSRLAYFSSPSARGVVKTIPLRDARVAMAVQVMPNDQEFCVHSYGLLPPGVVMPNDQEFRVHSYGRSFCLRASSDVDRSEWVFALQLVTKDAMADDATFAEYARRQAMEHQDQVPGSGHGSGQHHGQVSTDSSGRADASGTHGRADTSGRSVLSASSLKRKIAEALPFESLGGAPTPALSLSNPASRDNSLHSRDVHSRDGSRHSHGGHRGVRSLDSSYHNPSHHSKDDSRSTDNSQHGFDDAGDDGGKRVRKDPAQLSQTLSTAGQQAVELTMRYLAHVLLMGKGPFQVHEVVWVINKAYEGLETRAVA
ncbi:hypothetical protein T484DRAFT_1782413, partial [Baffinella frigidus]